MGKVITICNFKGGTGKSTTTHTLAVGLHQRGYKVLLVDADPQCNLSMVSNIDTRDNVNTIYELIKGEREPQDVISHTPYYDIICGSLSVSRADNELTKEPYLMNCYYLLKEQIDKVKDNYNFVIIDTPPTLALITQNCLVASDSIIVPTQADSFCISGLANLKKQLDIITSRTTNKELYIEGILLVKYSERTTLNKILRDELFNASRVLNTKVYPYAIRESVGVRESQTMKSNVLIDNPKNNASVDYTLFIEEFIKDNKERGIL